MESIYNVPSKGSGIMYLPVIKGTIERRILANFRIDPEVICKILPQPFRPKIVQGHAIGGICLIRLAEIRPRFFPVPWGIRSENAAHRIAVEWISDGQSKEGAFIPRRDTNSRWNTLVGGRIFPGTHHIARFEVAESDRCLSVRFQSEDSNVWCRIEGTLSERLPKSSVFSSIEEASRFFRCGSLGYSATPSQGRFEGLELRCEDWHVEALRVSQIESSFFEDESTFPHGSAIFDCALVMRNIRHEWHAQKDLCCG